MEPIETETFTTDRHPTLGDAAGRHVAEQNPDAPNPSVPQITPLMKDAVIHSGVAKFLTLAFLFVIVAPGLWASSAQFHSDSALSNFVHHHPTTRKNETFSDKMLDYSPGSMVLKRTWGVNYSIASGDPLGQVIIGRDGYLFYKEEYDLCVGRGLLEFRMPRVVQSVVQYSRDLDQRGIHFIVMPIPAKTAIIPWKLSPDYPTSLGPALNSDYRAWIQMLRDQGVDVLDLTDDFWQMSLHGDIPYLRHDTHWTPPAMLHAADVLSRKVQPFLGTYAREKFSTSKYNFSSEGDLVDLMGDKGDTKKWPLESLELTGLLEEGRPVQAGDESTVLLLGDSYSQIYADPTMVPLPAGLPQHLMLNLGCKVQAITGYGPRFSRGREILAEQPQTLRNKKVVIWEFTSRVLPDAHVALPPP